MTHRKHKPIKMISGGEQECLAVERGRRLIELATAMDTTHAFHKGQLVRWKNGLRNRAQPEYNEFAVVREILAEPVFDECEHGLCSGTPYFGEPLTLVLAVLDDDGDFMEFRYDARRFEPAES